MDFVAGLAYLKMGRIDIDGSDQVFSAETLLSRVRPSDSDASAEAITACVKRLRKKLDRDGKPSPIKTIYGVGYKFDPTS